MHRTLALAVFLSLLSPLSGGQDAATISSDLRDLSRPVSTLISQLRKREHVSVTYEDPQYSNSADIEDVTAEVVRDASTVRGRVLIPKGKAITFVYAEEDLRSTEAAKTMIARMLSEYEALGGPKFDVIGSGPRLHVIPAQILNAAGNRVRRGSILDTPIFVPSDSRNGSQLLEAICNEVRRQTGYEIGIGPSAPGNVLMGYKTSQGFRNETARTALGQLLDSASAPGSFVWDLYYDPAGKDYMLNFAYVGNASMPER